MTRWILLSLALLIVVALLFFVWKYPDKIRLSGTAKAGMGLLNAVFYS
jgi:hypothetical protein